MAAFPSASESLNEAIQLITKKIKTTKRNYKKQANSKRTVSKPNKILNENLTYDYFLLQKRNISLQCRLEDQPNPGKVISVVSDRHSWPTSATYGSSQLLNWRQQQ
ncbi:hypothetical protein NPIL_332581 [Nephila pilipes]|uniref:Uncharacterized protein n=1 Tax=Nephila pilipes TaxID=299642 RepID=A0A8X6QQJ8_NEPPI|nr:hypothetical protein NPIL_332581 [Nephila pilipes]